jgi:hypothetical protein
MLQLKEGGRATLFLFHFFTKDVRATYTMFTQPCKALILKELSGERPAEETFSDVHNLHSVVVVTSVVHQARG